MTIAWDLLGKRAETMRHALEHAPENPTIVETGCYRGNPHEGMSTVTFLRWVTEHGGLLHSVDIDPAAVAAGSLFHPVTLGDSVDFLVRFDRPIDVLYLDSHDYPDGPLRDIYGGKDDIHAAIATLDAMGEAEIVARHGDLILPSQEHCADEVVAALPNLHSRSVVVIDDAALPGGGKARLARGVLAEHGWRCVLDAYQTVWVPG